MVVVVLTVLDGPTSVFVVLNVLVGVSLLLTFFSIFCRTHIGPSFVVFLVGVGSIRFFVVNAFTSESVKRFVLVEVTVFSSPLSPGEKRFLVG